ncbi:hypothetical protein ACQUZK_09685, partial [Streptococcus pyogenes]|uniref:hypothetical protein n=1 Tax=Streptococcus pyogenes TaxID=1314 RepID=UPI003DA06B03
GPDLVVALDRGVRAANRPVVTAGTSAGDVLGLGALALPVEGDGAPGAPTLGVAPLVPAAGDADAARGVTVTIDEADGGGSSARDLRWDGEAAQEPGDGPYPA